MSKLSFTACEFHGGPVDGLVFSVWDMTDETWITIRGSRPIDYCYRRKNAGEFNYDGEQLESGESSERGPESSPGGPAG